VVATAENGRPAANPAAGRPFVVCADGQAPPYGTASRISTVVERPLGSE